MMRARSLVATVATTAALAGGVAFAAPAQADYDTGGYVVDFGPSDRHGSTYVELAVISKSGQFRF